MHWCHCRGTCCSSDHVAWRVCVCVYFSHFQMEKERRKDGLPLEDRYGFFTYRGGNSAYFPLMFGACAYTRRILLAFTAARGWWHVSTGFRAAPGSTSSLSTEPHECLKAPNGTRHRGVFCTGWRGQKPVWRCTLYATSSHKRRKLFCSLNCVVAVVWHFFYVRL